MLESFKLPFQEAVEKAAAVGAQGLQIYMSKPTVTYYEDLNEKKIKELLDMIKSNGLVVSAICGDFKLGFANPETNPMQIERSKRVLDLAKYFETNIVTTHIGTVPSDKNDPTYKIMQDACGTLGEYADSIGSSFAIETGPETALVLREFLDSLPSKKGMAVNMDPANLVIVMNDDPVQAVQESYDAGYKEGYDIGYNSGKKAIAAQTEETPPAVTEPESEHAVSEESPEDLPPTAYEEPDYIVNISSFKFHLPDCGSVSQISDENKQEYVGTREELIASGYDPCKNCSP